MTSYTYVVTQRVNYYAGVEFDSPEDVRKWIENGEGWDDKANEVLGDRVQVYDENGFLVLDTEPGDCTECGRSENAGFIDGDPRCHRHMEKGTRVE